MSNFLEDLIIPANALYAQTEEERMKVLRPVVEELMTKIKNAMANSHTSAIFTYTGGATKLSLNDDQVTLLADLFGKKGYQLTRKPHNGPTSGYEQLQIRWSVE